MSEPPRPRASWLSGRAQARTEERLDRPRHGPGHGLRLHARWHGPDRVHLLDPGMGQYFYQALNSKDVPVIQGVTLLVALIFIAVNLFVDVMYAYLNPRVRLR